MANRITSKGQVTIPKPVRDHLGLAAGNEVAFRRAADGSIILEKADATNRPQSRIASLRGHAGRGMSTDEIMALLRGDD